MRQGLGDGIFKALRKDQSVGLSALSSESAPFSRQKMGRA
jgi:hypothetical protein